MHIGSFILEMWRDLKSGVVMAVLLIIILTITVGIWNFFIPLARTISDIPWIQLMLIVGMIITIGSGFRFLKNRKVIFLEFLPTASLEKPEVMWEVIPNSGRFQTGILLEAEVPYKGRFMARVAIATAGPTSVGLLSYQLIPMLDIDYTGRNGGQVFAELMRLGGQVKGGSFFHFMEIVRKMKAKIVKKSK